MTEEAEIVDYREDYLSSLRGHFPRHWLESGNDGLHFLPFDLARIERPQGFDADLAFNDMTDRHWERMFLLLVNGVVRGHARLKNDPMDAGRHRCELGMGIESKWRGQGFGHALLSRVAALAQAAKHLQWLDLKVMAENAHAIGLYQEFGFQEVGRISDRFRIGGAAMDEISMVLYVGD
jgi:RimJ/RimL family protein N-acetyltransferase